MNNKYNTRLNAKQEKFLNNLVETGNQTQSYKNAYGIENDNSAAACSSKMLKLAKIKKAYEEKLEELSAIQVLNIEQRKQVLVNEIMKDDNKAADKVKALDILNKMDGVYIEKIEADHNISVEIGGNLKTWAE